jgi:hypothetical protein
MPSSIYIYIMFFFFSLTFILTILSDWKISFASIQLSPRTNEFMKRKLTYSAFFLTVAIGNCILKLMPPVNFCSDENIQTIFGTKFEVFLYYRTEYNSIS